MTATFPLFSRLPPELRNEIWHAALPHNTKPCLFPYRAGCWCPRQLLPSDVGFDPVNAENNLALEFRHSLLDKAQIRVPIAFADADAYSIAIAWAREQSPPVCHSREGSDSVFLRLFDPARDAVYVAPHQWEDFLNEPIDRSFRPDLVNRSLDIRPGIERIAVSEALLESVKDNTLTELYDYYYDIRTMYIIVETPADLDLRSVENNDEHALIWELENTQRVASWTGSNWKYDCDDGKIRNVTKLASDGLRLGLLEMAIPNFEIHMAAAVRN